MFPLFRYVSLQRDDRALLSAILLLIVMSTIVFVVVGQNERDRLITTFESRMVVSSRLHADDIAEQVDRIKSDARFLAHIQSVAGLVRAISNNGADPEGHTSTASWRQRLESTFSGFATENPNLTQIRLIGVADNGRELARIERHQGKIVVVPVDQLQAKGDRDYFKAIAKLSPGQVYVSEINLNREHGQIEKPFVRTLRAGIPVFLPDGTLFGMVVVNLNVQFILNQIQAESSPEFQVYLINGQGDYLVHPDVAKTFGFDLGRRWRWQDEHVAVSDTQEISQTIRDFSTPDGVLHTVMRKVILDPNAAGREVTIIVALPDTFIAQRVNTVRFNALILVLGVCFVASGTFYFYQRQRTRVSEKQAELAAIVESSRDAIIGKTLTGVVTSWNHGAELLFGYSAQEAIGRELVTLIIPDEYASQEVDILRRISQGEVVTELTTIRHRKDGSLLDVSAIVSPIRAADGRVIGAAKTVRDVSEQKAFEAKIQELNRSLEKQVADRTAQIRDFAALQRGILENAGFAIIAADTNGIITVFNRAAERMLGYQSDEIIGKQTPGIFHDPIEVNARAIAFSNELGETIAPGFDVFVTKALRGLPNEHEWTYVRKDGGRVLVLLSVTALKDDNGRNFGFIGVAADLTEQKAAEQALETNNRFLDTLTDNIPGMVGYWDTELRCRFANRAYQEWFGKSAHEMIGMRLLDLVGDDFYQKNLPYIEAALRGETQRFERTITKPNGNVAHTWGHFIPDRIAEQVRGFVVLVSDVTDLKQAQLALEELNLKLKERTHEAEAANRAKSEFLANMSHEIRTPMNAILGMLQLLQQTNLERRQVDYAGKAESAARALLGILNDILDFSKVEAGKLTLDPHPFSIDKLLRDVGVILSANVGSKDIEVLFEIDSAMPDWVVGDAMRLQQILINLAGNAIKFTAQGEVILAAKLVAQKGAGVSLCFGVRDTGIGISEEQCARIFEGFSQAEASTARRFGGTGLGLAISQRLVQLMGGSLNVESVVGQGSTFHFTIEFQRANPLETLVPMGLRSIPKLQNLHCLVIDDNATAREILTEMLASFGWKVDVASSGQEALTLLTNKQTKQAYDAIFVDWRMPVMDGWETCERIRELLTVNHATLIVMVTAHSRELLAQRQAQMPAMLDGVLVKPVTASMLFDSVADSRANKGRPAALEVPHNAPQQRLAGLRLLVVDDNSTNQQVASELLGNDGALVQVADCGAAAIAAIKNAIPLFDAILMDIQMPDMDGYAATKEIRETLRLRHLPIIAITANAMPSDRDKALAAGMNDHVGKPFDLMQLIGVIQRHTGRGDGTVLVPHASEKNGEERSLLDIDPEAALGRLGGRTSLYKTALRGFLSEIDALKARLRREMLDEDPSAVRITLHKLKGIAGIVGAVRLAGLALQAESLLQTAPPPYLHSWHELETLLIAITKATDAAKPVFAQLQLDDTIVTIDQPLESSSDGLKARLLEFQRCLRGGDLDAVTVFEDIRRHADIRKCGALLVDLEAAMAQLDFPEAMAQCLNMLEHLEGEPNDL